MAATAPLVLVYAALLGLVVGSYLNVLVYRLPSGRSTIWPRSRCPFCDGAIKARDNIPLLSFLLLRGRCRYCGAPISWRYPLIEGLTALLFMACVLRFGLTADALIAMLFTSILLLLAAIDMEHFLLPDSVTLPGLLLGLALRAWHPSTSFLDALVGAVVGAGLLILLINIWFWLRHEEGMGLGDVNMLALVGAFLGWQGVLTTLFVAALTGAVTGISLLLSGRAGFRSRLPFGVFLALGGIVSLFFGNLLAVYFNGLP
jgi:leader peptidase (prepilin peptidase)/N-methyltransferase